MTAQVSEDTGQGVLIDGAEYVADVAGQYDGRLAAVKERIDAYHADCSRRHATDAYHDAARSLRSVKAWLAGEHDRTYAGPHASFGTTLEDFRVHYANDALRSTLHHLLWAEHYAGLLTRDDAASADPWR